MELLDGQEVIGILGKIVGGTFIPIAVDATGHLILSATTPGVVRLQDGTTANLAVVDANGFLQVNLGKNVAGEDFSKSTTGRLLVTGQDGTTPSQIWMVNAAGQLAVTTEGQKATYHLSGLVVPAATPTGVIQLQGSASKLVRVLYVAISVASTAAGIATILLKRTSSTLTGGTSTAPTIGRSQTADGAATAAVLVFTANSTGGGALVANLGARRVGGTTDPLAEFSFTKNNDKGLVLNGTSEFMTVDGNGDTLLAGEVWAYDLIWSEE